MLRFLVTLMGNVHPLIILFFIALSLHLTFFFSLLHCTYRLPNLPTIGMNYCNAITFKMCHHLHQKKKNFSYRK